MTDSSGNAESSDKPEIPGSTMEPPPQAPGYPGYPPQPAQSSPQYAPQYSSAYPPPTGPYPGSYPPPPPMPYGGYGSYGGPAPGGAKNGMGTGALVAGLLSVPAAFTVIGGVLLGLLAVVLGFLGHGRARRGEASNGGVAIAGVVLGVLGIILSAVLAVTMWAAFNEIGGRDFVDCMRSAGNDRVAQQQCQDEFMSNFEDRFSISLPPPPPP